LGGLAPARRADSSAIPRPSSPTAPAFNASRRVRPRLVGIATPPSLRPAAPGTQRLYCRHDPPPSRQGVPGGGGSARAGCGAVAWDLVECGGLRPLWILPLDSVERKPKRRCSPHSKRRPVCLTLSKRAGVGKEKTGPRYFGVRRASPLWGFPLDSSQRPKEG